MYFSRMKIKAIITGTTGMVGKGVLIECLAHPEVEKVIVINRKRLGISNPKLTEIIHKDFSNFSAIKKQLTEYNTCFHCMGVSSIGKSEKEFSTPTYHFTKALVDVLSNKQNIVFNYVSGAGTDSSEKGNTMWARVKGKTENLITNAGFKDAYMFRAGMILPEKGVKSSTGWYNVIYVIFRPFFFIFKRMNSVTTSVKIGEAMINSVLGGQDKKHLENKDINSLANLNRS